MIIRCPDCSTGFKLPENRVTSSGIKLRCSRCSHVFRVRKTDSGETEIFYQAEDREEGVGDASVSESMEEVSEGGEGDVGGSDILSEAGNRTIFGMPSATAAFDSGSDVAESESGSDEPGKVAALAEPVEKVVEKVADPAQTAGFASAFSEKSGNATRASFNPFPHTGLDLKPRKRSAFGSIGEELAPEIEEATAAVTGNVDVMSDLQAHIAETSEMDAPALSKVLAGQVADVAAVQDSVSGVVEVAAVVPVVPVAPAVEDVAPLGMQGNRFLGAPEDFIDDSFEHDGPYFDPDREHVDVAGAGASAGSVAVAATPVAAAPVVAAMPAKKPAVPGAGRASGGNARGASPSVKALEPVAESWEVDDVSTDNLGGSTGVKLLLMTVFVLLIGAGFVGFVAAKNDGLLDFKQFGSMVEVAFGQGEYTPRVHGVETAPVVVAAVENPIEVDSVFAELADYGVAVAAKGRGGRAVKSESAGQVLVLRGQVRNRDQKTFSGVKLRGLVMNQDGRVLLETTAFLGGQVNSTDLEAVVSPQEAIGLLPKSSVALNQNMAVPFTVIFDEVPQAVLDKQPVMYRVEVASKDEDVVAAQTP